MEENLKEKVEKLVPKRPKDLIKKNVVKKSRRKVGLLAQKNPKKTLFINSKMYKKNGYLFLFHKGQGAFW
jgi:hypothetical protein